MVHSASRSAPTRAGQQSCSHFRTQLAAATFTTSWACDHYKTTLNATEFKCVYNECTNMVKEGDGRGGGQGPRRELLDAIVAAIEAGGLLSVNVDIIHTQIGQAAHLILPAVESGEMNPTSMNGERRVRWGLYA